MPSSLNSRIRAQRLVLKRTPAYSMIDIQEDGTFINTITGKKSDSLQDALTEAGQLRLAEMRRFGPGAAQNMVSTGSDVVKSEIELLNEYLMNPRNHERLRSMGFDNLVNGQITGTLMVFNTDNNRANIEALQSTINEIFPGELIITDGGMQLFSLSEAVTGAGQKVKLSASEQFLLKQMAGVGRLREDFVSSFFADASKALVSTNEADKLTALANVGSKLGKMTKRIQSIQSPRDVSFGTKIINELIESEGKKFSYVYDDVELMLRVAGGDLENLSPLERVLSRSSTQTEFRMQSAVDAANEAFETIEYATGLKRADGTYADTATQDLSRQLKELMEEAIQNKSPDETVLDYMKRQAGTMIDETGNLVKIPEEYMDDFGKLVMGIDKNLETFRDGTYLIAENNLRALLKSKENNYEQEFRRLTANGRTLTKQDQSLLNQLSSEIDKTRSALESHMRERNPARVGFDDGLFKGEGQVSTFSDISGISVKKLKKIESEYNRLSGLTTLTESQQNNLNYYETVMSARNFFENFFVIAPRSALKKEVGNQAAAISMNIATSHAEGVYMDPMQALVDPAFFTNQDLQKRITQNIDAQVAGIANFGTTGQVPEEILRQLEEQSSLDTSLLDPSAQASALRNRAEAREISNLLKSNVDPRQIPGLVNRVRNHYAIKAFREKGTSVDVLVPDAYRYQITTRGASGIRPNNMSSSGISQVPVAQGRSLNFVEFAVRGRQAVVSDNNASTYKAALGTFDLDDKVLPVMRTFKDENGRTRIGYITTRDPKGTQEMILMRPVMRDLETIQELAGASDDVLLSRFRSMGTIDLSRISQELSQANIGSSDMQNALGIIQGALKANKKGELFSSSGVQRGLNKASEDTMFAIETILRIVREGKYDPSAPSLLPEIPTSVIDELTLRGSAAIRGRDVLASSGRTVAQELGLGPEQGAPYSYKTFVEGQFSGQTDIATVRRFLDQVNSQLPPGMPRLTDGELGDFFSGDMAGVALRRRLGVTLDQATAIGSRVLFEANFLESLGAVGDVQNSIGMNINRMSSVSYLAPQLDDFSRQLSTMAPVGIPADLMTNILQESSTSRSFIAIAPSDIVDVINQLSGEQRIAPLSEKIAGLSPDQAARTRAGYEALAKQVGGATADTLHDFSIKPVNIALAQMEQQFAQLGTQRALGIAAGLSAEQLPGFDPSILNAGFGRMKSNDDIALLKRSVLQEQKRVRDRLLSSGVDASVVSRLDAEISSLERANSQQVRDILSLSNTSDFYRKYGSYSQAMDMGMFARGQIDTATATSFRMSDVLTRPVAKSEFVSKARALLESSKIKSLFNELEKYDSLGDKDTLQLDQNTIRTTIKYELGEELSKGLRAIRESYPGSSGKTLDIIETLNAEIVRTHGARYSSLLSYPGEEGAETTMMTLFELSKRRRLLMNQSYDARNLNYIQEAYRATINPVGDVTELSPQAARRILEAHTPDTVSIMGIEDVVNPRKIRDQNLLDFIEIIAESDNGLKVVGSRVNATRVAQEAYGMISRRTGLEAIDEEMSALGEVPATTSDGYAREVTSLMDEIERLEDESNPMLGEFFNAAKSPYRRIIDSFKDSDSALRQFIDSPGVKKFGIAMGATIAASFFYQSRKQKDLTSDSISGPPLLPGGNPYETEYPTRQSIIQDLNSNSQYSSGTQYQINTSGSMEDLNRLRGLFGDVIDGPINATMYDGLPMAGQDPYPDLASRF